VYSRLYTLIIKNPKFRFAESVPEFIVGTISLKSPIMTVEYIHKVQVRRSDIWCVDLTFQIYRSGVGKYYIEVKRQEQGLSTTVGYIFKLTRDEVVTFFKTLTSELEELYPDKIARLLRCVRIGLMGTKVREEIILFDSAWLPELYETDLHIIEKFSVQSH